MSEEQRVTNKFLELIALLLMILVSLFIGTLFGFWSGFFAFVIIGYVALKWLWSE